MKLFNEKTKPLSEYEKDAMWMSYKYVIGRHTITFVEHVGNMDKKMLRYEKNWYLWWKF